jgi:hypothetical protein
MFIPITSEVTLNRGMVLKEIATERLFEVMGRLNDKEEVWGDDPWELTEVEVTPGKLQRTTLSLPYQQLAMKYFAEVED